MLVGDTILTLSQLKTLILIKIDTNKQIFSMRTLGEDKVRTGQVVVASAFALASNSKHSYQEYFSDINQT